MMKATRTAAAAIHTAMGMPRTRPSESQRKFWSAMRTVSPPSMAMAMPTPAKPMPSVVMKVGVLSLICRKPLRKPMKPPSSTAIGTAARPRSRPEISLATSRLVHTAVRATIPSTERSIDPMRMTNVAPMHRTMGIEAELRIRMMLLTVRKLPLNSEIRMKRPTSTASGAHLRQCVRRLTCVAACMRPRAS